ncbi:hypothetical protein MiAbB_03869 [Microcystis aeruginosa NIES-4285]|uniref:Uncharacterized protein n=1 Tax=Microcystis aeruginosa NIES-4285 TaxID=2497681 RepID=A0A402DI91_MICAE|nr:hypothetical protein MiAbB_03869 [Microcystis aeruginosa NIES-4285]
MLPQLINYIKLIELIKLTLSLEIYYNRANQRGGNQ